MFGGAYNTVKFQDDAFFVLFFFFGLLLKVILMNGV